MKPVNLSFMGNVSDEDRILLNKIYQWACAAEEKYTEKFSFFLDERQQNLCDKLLKSICFENYRFFGGYESAKRTVLGLFPPYGEFDDSDFPIDSFTFKYRKADVLTHRDFLGSLMSQRIARDTVGDIIVSEGKASVFVYKTVSPIVDEITKIGKIGVKASRGFEIKNIPVQQFEELCGTVASLRLDCLAGFALKTSREKASALIKIKGAEVNHMVVNAPDFPLSEGDDFSFRGFGKFRFESCGALTKKNRIHIILKKYI